MPNIAEQGGYSSDHTSETPVDLAAVQADEELIQRLHRGEFDDLLVRADAQYDPDRVAYAEMRVVLARVLYAWRRDLDAEPHGELVDTDTAVAAVEAGRAPDRRTGPLGGLVLAGIGGLLFWLVVVGVWWLVAR